MFERGCKMFLMTVFTMLCCLVSAQAMENYEVNQKRLKEATFAFIEDYVNSKNDRPRKRMAVPARMFQYIPAQMPSLLPASICLINRQMVDDIAAAIGINGIIKDFAEEYAVFKESDLATKRLTVSNYLVGTVFDEERESIDLKKKSKVNEEVADHIARFLKIIE